MGRYIRHPFTAHCISEQKVSKFKREEKKRKKNLKKTSQDLTAARRILRTHIPFVKEKKHQTNSKKSFSPSLCFLLLIFSYSIFSLSSNLHIKLEKKRNILKEKKNQLQIKKMAHPSRRIRSLNI